MFRQHRLLRRLAKCHLEEVFHHSYAHAWMRCVGARGRVVGREWVRRSARGPLRPLMRFAPTLQNHDAKSVLLRDLAGRMGWPTFAACATRFVIACPLRNLLGPRPSSHLTDRPSIPRRPLFPHFLPSPTALAIRILTRASSPSWSQQPWQVAPHEKRWQPCGT